MNVKYKFLIIISLLIICFLLDIFSGSVFIHPHEWWSLLSGNDTESTIFPLFIYRLHKAETALLVGASLSLSGLFMQSVFKNPIVGPYVLGTSSAASLSVAIIILGGAITGFNIPEISLVTAAIIGSTFSLIVIIILYYRLKTPLNLLITGLMFGIFAGALINILSYFTQAQNLQQFVFWSMGNLGNQASSHLIIMTLILLISFVSSLFLVKNLNALLLGENYAKSMGINVYYTNMFLLIISGILVGIVTAYAGPIAFVGLAVPHIVRLFFNTYLHQILIPASLITGGILMLFCDMIAQVPGSSLSLPINSVTAIFGAPLVVYLIFKRK